MKSWLNLLGLIAVGSIVGFVIGFSTEKMDKTIITDIGQALYKFVESWGFAFQAGIILIFIIPGLLWVQAGLKIMQSEAYQEDEGLLEIKADKLLSMGIVFSQLYFITSFIIFAINVKERSIENFPVIIVFVIGLLLYALIHIMVYNGIKKVDELKKGDPTSIKFAKQWRESMDEAEKARAYEVGYKTNNATSHLLLLALVITFMAKVIYGASMGGILLVGGISLARTLIQMSYSFKQV